MTSSTAKRSWSGTLAAIRTELIWAAVATVIASVLAFVPLTNVLGYELAEAFCVFATISAASIALKRLNDGTVRFGRETVGRIALELTARGLLPLLPPLILLLLNALRVPNCDLVSGLLLYLLLPCSTVVVATTFVMAIAVLVHRLWLRITVYCLVVLTSVVLSALHLLLHPPIYAFHPLLGYFAGSIYDEAMTVPAGLLPFRLLSLAGVTAILAGIDLGVRRRTKQPWGGSLAVIVLAMIVWSALWAHRFDLHMEATREHIIDALGGVAESEHFLIYYPSGDLRIASQIDHIVADHEYRYAQYREFFGVEPELPVRSFIYRNHEQKEHYMGAGRTLIARPWLAEMHITWVGVGEGAMSHELAHIFSEPLGAGPLSLGGGGLLHIDMGLVEGIAEAAAWDADELTFHGWSAALYRLDIAPELADIISAAGFWSQYSGMAYTLMGSFSRWLIDQHGMEAYGRLYGSGDFEGVYGQPVERLVAHWREFLERLPLTEAQLELARYRYDRPPIFRKRCARALAARADEGRGLAAQFRFPEAVECLQSVVDDDPDNPNYRFELARLLRQAGRLDDAERVATDLLASGELGSVMWALVTELVGDVAWSRGDLAGAEAQYQAVMARPLREGDQRRLTIKLWGTRDNLIAAEVYDHLLASPPVAAEGLTLRMEARLNETNSPWLAYLLGLRLFWVGEYNLALDFFDRAVTRLTGDPQGTVDPGTAAIIWQARFRAAQCQFLLDRFDDAQARFEAMTHNLGEAAVDAHAVALADWIHRCRWADMRLPN